MKTSMTRFNQHQTTCRWQRLVTSLALLPTLICAITLSLVAPAAVASEIQTGDRVVLKKDIQLNTRSRRKTVLRAGQTFQVQSVNQDWLQIRNQKQTNWVRKDAVTKIGQQVTSTATAIAHVDQPEPQQPPRPRPRVTFNVSPHGGSISLGRDRDRPSVSFGFGFGGSRNHSSPRTHHPTPRERRR